MGKKGKKFIDKKSAVTFKVVHRSQQDPLIADENAPQYVLVPIKGKNDDVVNRVTGEGEYDYEDVSEGEGEEEEEGDVGEEAGEEVEEGEEQKPKPKKVAKKEERMKRIDLQVQQGIYFEDDYNYMQHLKPIGTDPSAVFVPAKQPKEKAVRFQLTDLPPEVLPSVEQNPIGMLNLAAPVTGPQLDVDLEVMAALDDDAEFDEEWELDDDFVVKAEEEGGEGEGEGEGGAGGAGRGVGGWRAMMGGRRAGGEDEEENDDDSTGGQFSDAESNFSHEETRSRFTEYSMTSSILSRSRVMQDLDDRFEKLYADYDEDQMGELDEEEAAGGKDISEFESVLDEYLEAHVDEDDIRPDPKMKSNPVIRKVIEEAVEEEMTEEEKDAWRTRLEAKERWLHERRFENDEGEEERKWDAQSIVSTYSNIYNHPKIIKEEPRKKKNTEQKLPAPIETVEAATRPETKEDETKEDSEEEGSGSEPEGSVASSMVRRKGETKEEKAARKAAVKAQRKTRRETKKATKQAFKTEELKQIKIKPTNQVKL